jgi:hypothetical protein
MFLIDTSVGVAISVAFFESPVASSAVRFRLCYSLKPSCRLSLPTCMSVFIKAFISFRTTEECIRVQDFTII